MKMLELPEDFGRGDTLSCPSHISEAPTISTCKGWNRLFNDKGIIRKHIEKASKQFMVLMLPKSFTILPMSIINLNGTPSVKRKREVGLLVPHYTNSYSYEFRIDQVFHCDGLLLCASDRESRFLVWNPLTNQSRWIQFNEDYMGCSYFFLGYNQDNKSCNKSYKVLSFDHLGYSDHVVIYDLNSDSCRLIDNDNRPGVPWNDNNDQIVSLKGNTYWLDMDITKTHLGIVLNKFDFSTEKLGRCVLLPYQCQRYENISVSVVKEEKLSVALQRGITSEIWVTDEIDETKAVSWNKVLALDLSLDYQISDFRSFLLDEEKKVVVCCETWYYDPQNGSKSKEMIYIVGFDGKVTELDLGVDIPHVRAPAIPYTPSLVQIEPEGGKRKICEYVTK